MAPMLSRSSRACCNFLYCAWYFEALFILPSQHCGYFCFNPPSSYPCYSKREDNHNNKLADDDDDDYEVCRLNRALLPRYYCASKLDAPRYVR